MVMVYDGLAQDTISLPEFHAAVDALQAPKYGVEYLQACAVLLTRLANNKDLFWDMIAACQDQTALARIFSPPQSFTLGIGETHYLRINFWLPKDNHSEYAEHQRELYAYQLAHNHDFRFMTVGYFGSGYQTDVYEMDAARVRGEAGEVVELKRHQRLQLHPGRVIYFAPYDDVHVQHEPQDISISINLIFIGEERLREQLLIDVAQSKVIEVPQISNLSRLITTMEIAALCGNQDTAVLLQQLGEHRNPRVAQAGQRLAQAMQPAALAAAA